jgi:heme-degrading monooxygenase HmoA
MAEICYIDWHVTPFRADRFIEVWRPAAGRAMAFGAKSWSLTRNTEDPLHVRQSAVWERREDFERYWYSEEISAAREQLINYYSIPILPVWHSLVEAE